MLIDTTLAYERETENKVNPKYPYVVTELGISNLTDGKWFDGLASGEFTDMWGREIEIKTEDLQVFVSNTNGAIEATRSESGELVGLPIDARDHERGEAAGWIVGAELSGDGKIVKLKPKWTATGRELIESGRMRFFSATFSLRNKTVLGGTLTNWPATRDKDEKVLLKPIELSMKGAKMPWYKQLLELAKETGSKIFVINNAGEIPDEENPEDEGVKPMTIQLSELDEKDRARLANEALLELAKEDEPAGIQLASSEKLHELVEKRAEEKAAALVTAELARHETKREVKDYVELMVSGDEKNTAGLPLKADEFEAFLLSLDEDQRKAGMALFTSVRESGMVDFNELGHQGKIGGKTPLPDKFAAELDAGGISLEQLADPMSGLGDLSEYDLSKWQKKEKE